MEDKLITKSDCTKFSDVYLIGEGLVSDQSATVTFGLGDDTDVHSISLALSDGTTQVISNPKVNSVYTL